MKAKAEKEKTDFEYIEEKKSPMGGKGLDRGTKGNTSVRKITEKKKK